MKITDPDIIKRGEKDLIHSIKDQLDWRLIEDLNKDKLRFGDVECTDGDIVVHENQVAYKMDFQVKISFSVLFDRQGNILEASNMSMERPSSSIVDSEDVHADDLEADIIDQSMADIEKELEEIDAFHKEADDILASLGADASIDISEEPMAASESLVEEGAADIDFLEEFTLPDDDKLGVLEVIPANDQENLEDAMAKSRQFWQQNETRATTAQVIDLQSKDELKLAFQKSQNFWLQK